MLAASNARAALLLGFLSGLLAAGALLTSWNEGVLTASMHAAASTAAPPLPSRSASPVCVYPSGWLPHLVQPQETLELMARSRGMDVQQVLQGNCLSPDEIKAGESIMLPLPAAPTPAATP